MATKTTSLTNGTRPEDPNQAPTMVIDQLKVETLIIPIIGLSPLIVHRFDEKAKRQMLDNAQGRKTHKEPKDPNAEYEASMYRTVGGGHGFPVTAFKQATVGAARFYDKKVTMRSLKQSMFFKGKMGVDGQSLVELDDVDPIMREDTVRVGQGGTDLRYRAQYTEWKTSLTVTYVTAMLTRDSLVSLIEAGGMGVGVGEWRPERDGDFGTYRVDPDREIEVVS